MFSGILRLLEPGLMKDLLVRCTLSYTQTHLCISLTQHPLYWTKSL